MLSLYGPVKTIGYGVKAVIAALLLWGIWSMIGGGTLAAFILGMIWMLGALRAKPMRDYLRVTSLAKKKGITPEQAQLADELARNFGDIAVDSGFGTSEVVPRPHIRNAIPVIGTMFPATTTAYDSTPSVMDVNVTDNGVDLLVKPGKRGQDSEDLADPVACRHIQQTLQELWGDDITVTGTVQGAKCLWSVTWGPDPLEETVTFESLGHIPASSNPGCVLLGMAENGSPYELQVLGKHTLLVGASGSGKGSVIWSTLAGLSGRIADGTLVVYGIDLKGGVEFTQGRHLFTKIAHDTEDVEPLLEDMNTVLKDRLAHMRETGSRKHQATVEHPDVLLLIDEAAALTYSYDSKQAKKIDGLIKVITTQGRAAGFSTLAAMQDPRKEAFSPRDTFTQTLALKFRTADDARLAIGASAYEQGAHCETIPASQPGTGYAITSAEGSGETAGVTRFRAFYATDEFIHSLPAAAPRPNQEATNA